jgi:hypothetical protein
MTKDPGRSPGAFIVPNCVQVRLNWTLPNGKIVHNVLHGRVAGGFAATAVIAEAIRAAIVASAAWTAYKVYVNGASALQGVDLRDMTQFNQPIVPSTGGSTAGTGVATSLPPGAAICITLRTAKSGQANRGRVFLPGLDSACDVAGTGAILAAANTAAVNFVTAVQTALTGQGITMCLQNPPRVQYVGAKTGTNHPARIAGTVDVTSISARSTTFRSQRRRALRV